MATHPPSKTTPYLLARTMALVAAMLVAQAGPLRAEEGARICGVEWPPFVVATADGLVSGLSIDIHREAFRRMNVDLKAELLPWKRCVDFVRRGRIDGLTNKSQVDHFLFGKHPTGYYPLVIFTRPGFTDQDFSFDGFRGAVVAMVGGYDYSATVREFDGWTRQDFGSDEKVLRALAAGRVDYILGDIYSTPSLAARLGIDVQALSPPVDSTPLYLGFSKAKPEMRDRHEAAMASMIEDGTLDRLYTEHVGYSYAEAAQRFSQR